MLSNRNYYLILKVKPCANSKEKTIQMITLVGRPSSEYNRVKRCLTSSVEKEAVSQFHKTYTIF